MSVLYLFGCVVSWSVSLMSGEEVREVATSHLKSDTPNSLSSSYKPYQSGIFQWSETVYMVLQVWSKSEEGQDDIWDSDDPGGNVAACSGNAGTLR